MTKLSWAIVCCLVVFNSVAIVASFTGDVRGAGCNEYTCEEKTFKFYECGHMDMNLDGDPCSRDTCIDNTLIYVACKSGEDGWSCAGTSDPNEAWLVQIRYGKIPSNNPCSSDELIVWIENSPENPCEAYDPYYTACQTGACHGVLEKVFAPRLGRPICGCR